MALGSNDNIRLLSRPFKVFWQGWETTTFRLQQVGWQLATERDLRQMCIRILMKHSGMQLVAITHDSYFDFDVATNPGYSDDGITHGMPIFNVQHIAHDFRFVTAPIVNVADFREIDAQPQIVHNHVIESVRDLDIFAPAPQTRTEEILVDRADMTVIEHLQAIKELQSEKQLEIRRRMLNERRLGEETTVDAKPASSVVAQLVEVRAA